MYSYFFKNGPSPASFLFILGHFQTNINTILQKINVKKCPHSIQHWDLNTRPSERESPPTTTRPGLPLSGLFTFAMLANRVNVVFRSTEMLSYEFRDETMVP